MFVSFYKNLEFLEVQTELEPEPESEPEDEVAGNEDDDF